MLSVGCWVLWAAAANAQPPPEFVGRLGEYRSPLLFDDGTRVVTAADWQKRRAEISQRWHDAMGPWPELVAEKRMRVIERGTIADGVHEILKRRVSIPVAPGRTQEGWLLLPSTPGPLPAVLVVYYEPETSTGQNAPEKHRHRDFALQLARRGFVTLSIGTPGGDAWKPDLAGAACQPLSYHAYVAANCWSALAAHSRVDRSRIGIVGHSYGGKWALFAGALWEKFACVAVSDPGIVWDESKPNVNYWEPWYLGADAAAPPSGARSRKPVPRFGAYARLIAEGRDLTDLHALIAPRPFHVSGGSEDPPERWLALNHAIAVNELLGQKNRISMTNRRDHSPDENSNAALYEFFERSLKPGAPAATTPPR